jgi:hypothetical protein
MCETCKSVYNTNTTGNNVTVPFFFIRREVDRQTKKVVEVEVRREFTFPKTGCDLSGVDRDRLRRMLAVFDPDNNDDGINVQPSVKAKMKKYIHRLILKNAKQEGTISYLSYDAGAFTWVGISIMANATIGSGAEGLGNPCWLQALKAVCSAIDYNNICDKTTSEAIQRLNNNAQNCSKLVGLFRGDNIRSYNIPELGGMWPKTFALYFYAVSPDYFWKLSNVYGRDGLELLGVYFSEKFINGINTTIYGNVDAEIKNIIGSNAQGSLCDGNAIQNRALCLYDNFLKLQPFSLTPPEFTRYFVAAFVVKEFNKYVNECFNGSRTYGCEYVAGGWLDRFISDFYLALNVVSKHPETGASNVTIQVLNNNTIGTKTVDLDGRGFFAGWNDRGGAETILSLFF